MEVKGDARTDKDTGGSTRKRTQIRVDYGGCTKIPTDISTYKC